MSEIQQNRYDQLLRRVADLKGPGSKVNDALGELFPVIDVENCPGELLLLQGTRLCFGAGFFDGGVGTKARLQVFNPAGSGQLVTVTRVLTNVDALSDVRMAVTQITLSAGIGTERFRDTRLGITGRPTSNMRAQATAASTDGHVQISLQANTPFQLEDQNGIATLEPGTGFEVGMETVNARLYATFFWRERTAQQSELAF